MPPPRPGTPSLPTHRVQWLALDGQGRKAAPEQAGLRGIPGSRAGGCPSHLTHSGLFFFFKLFKVLIMTSEETS